MADSSNKIKSFSKFKTVEFKNKRLENASKKSGIGMFTAISGRPTSEKFEKALENTEVFNKEIVKKIYIGEPVGKDQLPIDRKRKYYLPILKHPLPLSMNKADHEKMLCKILACKPEKQAISAVIMRNAWVLEEVYMRGAEVDIPDKNGFCPIHIAASLNCYEIIMILIHIGVDYNCTAGVGVTPLYLAKAANSLQVVKLLEEKGALMHGTESTLAPGANILDLSVGNSKGSVVNLVNMYVGLPNDHLSF